MKVAYLFSRYPVPSQTFCDTEMRALEALGVEVEIYSCSPPTTGFRHEAGCRPRAPVFYAPPRGALELWELAARRAGHWPAEMIAAHEARYGARYQPARRALHALYFTDLARRRGVDHLHVHFANRATHAALFMAALGAPSFSFTAHAQDFLIDLGSDALLGEMGAQAAFVVAVSDWSREVLARKCPESAGKIHRVYNGLPLDQWLAPLPKNDRAATDAPPASAPLQIFSVGRLIEFKGFADLIAACVELQRRGTPFHCEIAGEGPARASLERLIAEHALGENVRLLGLLPQRLIHERLARCDVFALACRFDENGACDVLPTVILEAMAAARPVVSTVLAGVPEMVDDGQTGRLAAPGDVAGLADGLAELAADPAKRVRWGQAGRAKLEARFSAEESARQLLALFQSAHPELRPKTTVSPSASSAADGSGILCLLAQWPLTDGGELLSQWQAALPHLRVRLPGLRFAALRNPAKLPDAVRDEAAPFVEFFEFLPDAMALEGEWREQAQLAHRLESWRGELGGAVETVQFLLDARRALYLHRQIANAGGVPVRHVWAVGGGAVLSAFLLARLNTAGGRSASFLVEAPAEGGPAGSALRKLAGGFTGGWIAGERKLAASLGPVFRGDDLPAAPEITATRLAGSLQLWAAGGLATRVRA